MKPSFKILIGIFAMSAASSAAFAQSQAPRNAADIIALSMERGLAPAQVSRANPYTEGQGMYCAMDAHEAVLKKAQKQGANKAQLNASTTSSLDPAMGVAYKTVVAGRTYYSIVEARDGKCVTVYISSGY